MTYTPCVCTLVDRSSSAKLHPQLFWNSPDYLKQTAGLLRKFLRAFVCVIGKEDQNELGFKERRVGTVTILDADGELRIKLRFGGSSIALSSAATSLVAAGQKHILLSLDRVNSISAKNLGELVSTYVAVKEGGGQFKLFNLTPMVRQLMKTTNLFAVFQLYETESNAVESFSLEAGTLEESLAWSTSGRKQK